MNKSTPRCFDSRSQFEQWMQAARRIDPGYSGYCADCTESYQQQMIAQMRCAFPRTSFHINSEGGIDGRRPEKDRIAYREGA